ncbi:MAG: riboflavin biosynthesis protein RibF [Candidatus Omnitrophica bacterium]|nr:riboflavin biosynthesis protein RibF [Candidatus Omnitrophota bacterium]
MRIITNLKQLNRQFRRPVVAIGIFDGVHLGHKKILKAVKKEAGAKKGTSVVLTFNPHPKKVLDLIVACVLDFNTAFAAHKAQDFVKDILVKRLGVDTVIIGSDFRFGRNKTGDIKLLKALGGKYGFSVKGIPFFKAGNAAVSSTRIRSAVIKGRFKEAQKLLGRPVSILGTVVKGSGRGKFLGCPTANIKAHHEAIPPKGIYAVYVMYKGKKHKGVLNIGLRPTFEERANPVIEAHIFGFSGDIYGKDIEVVFIKKLRREKRFSKKEELIKQIKIDERNANMLL